MPIYAYRCGACGHARDILQKLSDPVLTTCPSCGAEAFSKQVTAAGFQLKGSGWYVTDFRDGGKKAGAKEGGKDGDSKADTPTPAGGGDKAASGTDAAAPAPASTPAAAPATGASGPSSGSSGSTS
jgi:putative FmdB family regulatory protein